MYKHDSTTISVSKENYLALKRLGGTGDSFNDVLTEVLKKVTKRGQIDSGFGPLNQSAINSNEVDKNR